MLRSELYKIRDMIVKASASLSDADALEAVVLFDEWKENADYKKPKRVQDPSDGFLYELIPDAHRSQSDWPPHLVPAIWKRVANPAEEWPEWIQPTGAHDTYDAGAKVSHNEHHWINTYGDGNSWEPGVFGWDMVE